MVNYLFDSLDSQTTLAVVQIICSNGIQQVGLLLSHIIFIIKDEKYMCAI